MVTIVKASWWDELADYYSFANSGSSSIDLDDLFEDLYEHVDGSLPLLLSSSFKSSLDEVLEPSSQADRSNELIPLEPTDMVIGYEGRDFLAGDDGDNILYGGQEGDYFSMGAGIDFVIGDDNGAISSEVDIAGYFHATSGIVVLSEYTNPNSGEEPPPGGGGGELNPNQDVYTPTYEDWLARNILQVSDFEVGPGGDFIDLSVALASIGYTGDDPVADGYVKFGNLSSGMKIQFDSDGPGGSGAKEMVRILGISVEEFSIEDNLSWDGSVTGSGGSGSGSGTDDSLFTFVYDDGNGSYDILYAVEGIFGSDYDDEIHGHTELRNILYGSLGNDHIFGEGGNDVLIGGTGNDIVDGGTGDDLIITGLGNDLLTGGDGQDTFKFSGSIGSSISANISTILDFETGSSGDVIDVAEILNAIGYAGSNAVADGYVRIVDAGTDTHIQIDLDGFGGGAGQTLAVLEDVDSGNFSITNNLITDAPKALLVSILGQSNAAGLRVFDGDSDSGITRMEDMLEAQTDYDLIVTPFLDQAGYHVMPAIGGTRVDGNSDFDADDVWWFPDQGEPGEILIRAVEILAVQIAELRESGSAVKPTFVWGQGESDAILIGEKTTTQAREAAQDRYMDATLDVFNYIRDRLGDDVEIYIMETGRYNPVAAQLDGVSQQVIDDTMDGLVYIRDAQAQLALNYSYIHLAASYQDLPMLSEVDPGKATDVWHYAGDEREIIGDRLGDFIALEQGFDHVLDNPGTYPLYVLSALDLKDHPGMVVNGNSNDNIVVGTDGNDTLTGGAGDDALYGGSGFDEVLYTNDYADYTVTNGTWITVEDNESNDGFDTLIDIEKIIFADGFYQNGTFFGGGGGNNDPIARDDNFVGNQDIVITGNVMDDNGNGIDFDPEGDPLNVVAETIFTAHGTVVLQSNGDFTYTPDSGYFGPDGFSYTLEDDQGGDDTGDVSITLNEVTVNTSPVAVDDSFIGDQDIQITGNVLADNGHGVDFDPDLDPLNIVAAIITTAHGSVSLQSNGSFVYTPDAGYFGDDSFAYTVQDGLGGEDVGNVSLTLNSTTPGIYGTSGDDFLSGTAGNDTIYGLGGNDTIKGRDGDDILYGGDGDDYIEGNNGDDILYGGIGADTIKGSNGTDTYVWTNMNEAGDTIKDYRIGDDEVLDISDILIGYNPTTDAITDFVQITDNGTDSFLSVDADGGADNFVLLATLQGVTGLTDEELLETNGNLVTV